MKLDKYGNYLLVIFVILLITNYVVLYFSWKNLTSKGVAIAICGLVAINITGMYSMTKIKVYDNKGIERNFGQALVDIIAVTVLLVIITIIGFIVVSIGVYGKSGLVISILSTLIFYGSLALVTKVQK